MNKNPPGPYAVVCCKQCRTACNNNQERLRAYQRLEVLLLPTYAKLHIVCRRHKVLVAEYDYSQLHGPGIDSDDN